MNFDTACARLAVSWLDINTEPRSMDRLWYTREEAADYLQFSVKTLANWAAMGQGPDLRRIGRAVRYHQQALDDFIQRNGASGKPPRYRPGSRKRRPTA